ncbi:MAG: hypothetical protein V4545_00245 [Pseudomonadota bacterium]
MIISSYKGTFKANKPHNRNEEDELHNEMQELANITHGGRGIFNKIIQIGIDALNKEHKNVRTYEAHFLENGVQIIVSKLNPHPHPYVGGFSIPSCIGEYSILFPDN